MEDNETLIKIAKIFFGSLFAVGTGYYIYKSFLSSPSPKSVFLEYIDDYITSLKEQVSFITTSNSNSISIAPSSEMKVLAHVNFILEELILNELTEKHSEIIHQKRNTINNEAQYVEQCKKYFKLKQSIKQCVLASFQQNYNFEINDSSKVFLNSNLINLNENKNFTKLIPFPESLYQDILNKHSKDEINDAFFFASCKQIEYDKLINESMNEINTSSIENDTLPEMFKEKFKDMFFIKYKFDCKYLPELVKEIEGKQQGDKLNCLINRIVF